MRCRTSVPARPTPLTPSSPIPPIPTPSKLRATCFLGSPGGIGLFARQEGVHPAEACEASGSIHPQPPASAPCGLSSSRGATDAGSCSLEAHRQARKKRRAGRNMFTRNWKEVQQLENCIAPAGEAPQQNSEGASRVKWQPTPWDAPGHRLQAPLPPPRVQSASSRRRVGFFSVESGACGAPCTQPGQSDPPAR